ncbi:carbohydrate ABC transporter permease [Tessaracoccus sp. OH4464_COT-324]|uniref:carbohydrate ABC transporter permease n=1 Tax=Tessaracoccus sp. OH4464_COT-324 TaxID=2491059 RepID=UPI000F644C0A|nr:sugar ABC transporter permease [Tessaracoccus sp. OH4464_COT-324]RRD46831.1 sugar ABC transporter permease [Tessaracoccus sp. OH4464_COT-324]
MTTSVDQVSPKPRASRTNVWKESLRALPWLLPTVLLIFGVVLYPAVLLFYYSLVKYNKFGISQGFAGFDNYFGKAGALTFPTVPIGQILINTVVWVVVTVAVTVLLSLALAQFLNKKFRGRKLLRLFIILPWACSVVMTTTVFNYGLQTDVGLFNRLLVDTGILETAYGFTKDPTAAFWVAVFVAVYVSLPFTTYTILAGLQAVPADVLEASHVDGANAVQRYWHIVLPILRPSIAVATLINIINVFNSLPILKILNDTPGYHTGHTTTTLIFEYKAQLGPGVASALSVINFAFCLVIIVIYLAVVKPTKEVDA